MVEYNNQGDFIKIEYNENNQILKIYDKYENYMKFSKLPKLIFEEFEESDFSYDYLETKIINNPRLGYKKTETFDGDLFSR